MGAFRLEDLQKGGESGGDSHGVVPGRKAAPVQALALAAPSAWHDGAGMWDQPYLETCCRSALHRLSLAGEAGRPPGLKDGPCLQRLAQDGFARARADGRYEMTEAGMARHASEIMTQGRKEVLF
jgi:hypothetical protein